ncbi:MAG: DUF1850 domain-containing protein [Bacillota bacterium]
MNKKIFFPVIILLFTGFLFLYKIPVLTVVELSSEKTIFITKTFPNDIFSVKWMHSVELQPWEEIFQITDDYTVMLKDTRFKSFGAGVPDAAGKRTTIEDGYIVFHDIDRAMPELVYGVSDYAKHVFFYKDREIKLYEKVPDDSPVKISVISITLPEYILRKVKF